MKRILIVICLLLLCCGVENSWAAERNHITLWSHTTINGFTVPLIPTTPYNVYAIILGEETTATKSRATYLDNGVYYWPDIAASVYDIYVQRILGGSYVKEITGLRLGLREPINLTVTTGKIYPNAVTTAKIADGAVTTSKVGFKAITPSRVDNESTFTFKREQILEELLLPRLGAIPIRYWPASIWFDSTTNKLMMVEGNNESSTYTQFTNSIVTSPRRAKWFTGTTDGINWPTWPIKPLTFDIRQPRVQTINKYEPLVLSFMWINGYKSALLAAESLWIDGLRGGFCVNIDSIGTARWGTSNFYKFLTWDDLRLMQAMGMEIWQFGGHGSFGVGGPTRWGQYTNAQLDTAISNTKNEFLAQGISPAGFMFPEADSACCECTRPIVAKHYSVAGCNSWFNFAIPLVDDGSYRDSSNIWNCYSGGGTAEVWKGRRPESLFAFASGHNAWVTETMWGGTVLGWSSIFLGDTYPKFWRWADSSGVVILPPAEAAKQWYNQGWPKDFNPLVNGDFHRDIDQDGRPDGWWCVDSLGGSDPAGDCLSFSSSMIVRGGPHGGTPIGRKNYAMIYPQSWTTSMQLRGSFSGFHRPSKYAFSYWARNDRNDDTTVTIKFYIYRLNAHSVVTCGDGNYYIGSIVTLPNDTLWHKIDYTVDPNLIMPVCESMMMCYLGVRSYAGNDTCYVTGFEAHPYNEDRSEGINRGWIPIGTNLFFSANYDTIFAITPTGEKKSICVQ
jgi:hypothetical protein